MQTEYRRIGINIEGSSSILGAMAYQNLEPLSRQLTVVIGLTVVGFMALGLTLSFYRNVLFDQTLADLDVKNAELRDDIVRSRAELEYYQSAQFRDKFAKEKLGLINPGEQVLILTRDAVPGSPVADSGTAEQQEAAYLELLRQMPVLSHWRMYLLEPERARELRESFVSN